MPRHRLLPALAAAATFAMPGAALADDDDDVIRIPHGFTVPQVNGLYWDRDDDHRWEYSYRLYREDDERWGDDDDDDDDRRGRWDDDDDDD